MWKKHVETGNSADLLLQWIAKTNFGLYGTTAFKIELKNEGKLVPNC